MMRWCWVNFQCRGVLLIWIIVGQGPIALAEGAGGGCLDIFSLVYHFSFLSPSLSETARYRLTYCLKGSLSPKSTNQPTHAQLVLACTDLSKVFARYVSHFCLHSLCRQQLYSIKIFRFIENIYFSTFRHVFRFSTDRQVDRLDYFSDV